MKIAVIAGEKSGDNYGAALIDSIRRIKPDVSVIGTGGEGIKRRADIFIDCPYGKMGFSGVLSRLHLFYRAFKEVKETIERENPSFVVFIDNPGLNLKLADTLGKKHTCFYYIPPKVWAHNYKRIRIIKSSIRAVITIFPFERTLYQKEGIPAFWFGHPVTDLIKSGEVPEEGDIPVIGLLPGSREEEVRYLLPVFIRILRYASEKRKIAALLSASDKEIRRIEEDILKKEGEEITLFEGSPEKVINGSSLLLAASGTVNLEVALYGKPLLVFYKTTYLNYILARLVVYGKPLLVFYKTTYLNYILARLMVKLDMISPVNLIMGEKVVPEYIQQFPYRKIVKEIDDILDKGLLYQREMEAFAHLKEVMGSGSVSEKVAGFLIKEGWRLQEC